jgi:hypothetical protein
MISRIGRSGVSVLTTANSSDRHQTFCCATFRVNPAPLLLMLRLLIMSAFSDCYKLEPDGSPTTLALDALTWILGDTNWVRHHAGIPPADVRKEYVWSFEWACSLLDFDPDTVREQGCPRSVQYNADLSLGGLPRVFRAWTDRRQQWLAKQVAERDTLTPEAHGLVLAEVGA